MLYDQNGVVSSPVLINKVPSGGLKDKLNHVTIWHVVVCIWEHDRFQFDVGFEAFSKWAVALVESPRESSYKAKR